MSPQSLERVKNAPGILSKNELDISVHNNGHHIIVEKKIDYWPSTDKFIVRGEKKKRFGIENLIDYAKNIEFM